MPSPTVRTIRAYMDDLAPFDTAEDFDNAGFLVGRAEQEVKTILCSLDVTMETVLEAERLGAQLIVSHHPLLFRGVRRLTDEEPESTVLRALIQKDISLISAHTNWDKTVLSGSACAARALGVQDLSQSGYLFTGRWPEPVSAAQAAEKIRAVLRAPLRMYGDRNRMIRVISFAGGAYGEGYREAEACGAQAYCTGEIKHHEITDAVARGMVIFEAGHYASEAPMIPALASCLREKLSRDGLYCQVKETSCVPFSGALDQ